MGRKSWLLVIGLGTGLAVICGCGNKSSSGGGNGTVTLNNYGGQILLSSSVANGSEVFAEFVSAVSPQPTPLDWPVATGTCVVGTGLSILPTGQLGTLTEVSVGATLTFTSGSTSIPVDLAGGGGVAVYSYSKTGQVLPAASHWTVANSGASYLAAETLTSILMPGTIAITGIPTVTSNQELTLNWTGGTGANDVEIDLSSLETAEVADCSVPNTGSFTIPASVTTAVGNGALIAIGADSITKVTINGRDVVVIGENTP